MKSLCLFLLAACTAANAQSAESSTKQEPKPKPKAAKVHRISVTQTHLLVSVISHGCTRETDFTLEVKQKKPLVLVVNRNKPDLCRARGRAFNVGLAFEELPDDIGKRLYHGETFHLDNPIMPVSMEYLSSSL